jgi:cyanophycin synthetase
MRVLQTQVFVGPSLYAHFPVIRLTVDLGAAAEWPTGRLGEVFAGALLEALPGLAEHGVDGEGPGSFAVALTQGHGVSLAYVLERVALELQNVAGARVSFGRTRPGEGPGVYTVVYAYDQDEVGREAGVTALELLHHLLPDPPRTQALAQSDPREDDDGEPYDFAYERDALIRFAERRALGPSTASLVRAAEERGIPWIRLNERSLIQFGHGRWQRRIQATVTSETRYIAVEVASDKELTNRILADLGLPVPRQITVHSEDDAVRAARKLGGPVVVKPLDANHGRGVSLDLRDEQAVRAGFRGAREHSRTVIVETYLTGFDHRMLVVNGELIAVAKRVPGHVVGDGEHTVGELVDLTNRDPRRGIGHEKVLTRLEFDAQAERLLAARGYDRETVPPAGEVVYLRSTGNISTGGTAIDVTDVVHPDNREMALRAVSAVGLDVGGVDFLTDDVARSYREIGGGICEVNAAPGFRMHVAPSEGTPRDVAGPVMDMLFPASTPRRIPIAAVTGTNGKTTTVRMLAHLFKMKGSHVGLTTTDGVYIDGVRTVEGDMTGPNSARMVLRDPHVDVAVLETARGGLLRSGMGFRRCDVGAVLNVASDHLGLKGIDTLEALAEVKRIVVEVAEDTAVLNADDPHVLRMADYTQARNICYVTMNPGHRLVREHIRAGGRAMVLEEGMNGHMITLYDRGTHVPLLWTHLIPATLEGRAIHNVQNAMFAAAMAFSMGLKAEDVRHGLRTFDTTFFQAPGRMNVYDEHPFKVILDYGHNPAAVRAMVDLVQRLRPEGRRIVVLSAPGDRRDEDVREVARIAAGGFDEYIVRRDDHLRGRGSEEIPGMLRETLLASGVEAEHVHVIPSEEEAVAAALRMARPRDLLLVFVDAITRSWKQVINFEPEGGRAADDRLASLRVAPLDVPEPAMDGEGELVRDERGVRLARRGDAG